MPITASQASGHHRRPPPLIDTTAVREDAMDSQPGPDGCMPDPHMPLSPPSPATGPLQPQLVAAVPAPEPQTCPTAHEAAATSSVSRLPDSGEPAGAPDADADSPRSSFSSDAATPPKRTLRRASGRRPLSVLSISSINSDSSPLHTPAWRSNADLGPPGLEHSLEPHSLEPYAQTIGLGVYDAAPGQAAARAGQIPLQTPDVSVSPRYSPGKHRRHRSMMSGMIDYRTHYVLPHYVTPFRTSAGARASTRRHSGIHAGLHAGHPPAASPAASPAATLANFPDGGFGDPYAKLGSDYMRQYGDAAYAHPDYSPYSHLDLYTKTSPGQSPTLGSSPLTEASPLGTPQTPRSASHAGFDPLQHLLEVMACRQRQVLEARQNLDDATAKLNESKKHLKSLISAYDGPLRVPLHASIIRRKFFPNIGIHGLACLPRARHRRARDPLLRIVVYHVDSDVARAVDDEFASDDDDDDEELAAEPDAGIALRIVKCLLGIVHCIIATLPVHQRDFAHQSFGGLPRRLAWIPEYPLPMEAMFGHLAYEP